MENKLQTAENNHMSDKMKQENPQIYAKKKERKKSFLLPWDVWVDVRL